MKKILCFTLALLLCLSSVCTAYASSTNSDHGGTGGSLGDNHGGTGGSIDWDKLQPCDDELINKAKETLNYMIFPDKAGVAAELLSFLGSSDLDDDTKKYMDDNLKDNVKTDGTYFYYSPTYIQNINQKVQNRVHALNGYYLVESSGALTYDNLNNYYIKHTGSIIGYGNLSNYDYNMLIKWINTYPFIINFSSSPRTYYSYQPDKWKDSYYFLSWGDHIAVVDMETGSIMRVKNFKYVNDDFSSEGTHSDYYFSYPVSDIIALFGESIKVFYSIQDIRNYINQGQQHYSPNLPNKTIKIPINYINVAPKLNLDFDISGKLADEIQGQLDLNFNAWLDKLAEICLLYTS